MYEDFFGFRERPFDLTPNPRFLVPTDSHVEALRNLEYGIASRTGVMLLLGDAGLGKTTTIRAAIDLQPSRVHCCHLTNPTLTRAEFNETLARAFGLSTRAHSSKASMLLELEAQLATGRSRGETTVLVVDEAQSMPDQLLEEVQFLGNIENEGQSLVSIVLAGQHELSDRLNEPHLRELKQRAALRCEIRPLTLGETGEYIAGRIQVAGGPAEPIFLDESLRLIHEASRGVPRTINVVADNALLGAFAAGRTQVDADIVREVCRDFTLEVAPEVERPHVDVLPGFAAAVVPPPTRSARRRVFGYVAGFALLLAAVAIPAGIMAPAVPEPAEPTAPTEPTDAALAERQPVTPINTTPVDTAPVDVPETVDTDRTAVDSEPVASPPDVPVATAASTSRTPPPPPPVERPVQTAAPPVVPGRSQGSNAGAVTNAQNRGQEEPPVSPTVSGPPSQSANAPPPPSPGARPRLPIADEPPVALAAARAASPGPSAPPPTPVAASTPPPGPAPEAIATAEIQSVLARYRHALETLSAAGIETVWPSVDTGNLQRAFDQLSEQSIEFDSCAINLTAASRAAASCRGRASVVRKVGGGEPRLEPRQWTFHLLRADDGWTIDRVESR